MNPVLAAIDSHRASFRDGVIAAVSGGADSVAMLAALVESKIHPIHVFHVNHKLRGEESDEDERFVRELTGRWTLPMYTFFEPVEHTSKIEETARKARMRCAKLLKTTLGLQAFATAHTADDRAETLLFNLVRGSGFDGLSSIASNDYSIKPFLALRKSQLIDFLNERKFTWRDDSSNASRAFSRNRLRHDVMPVLESMNPKVIEKLNQLADAASEMQSILVHGVHGLAKSISKCVVDDTIVLTIDRDQWREQPTMIRAEFFRMLWKENDWPMRDMTQEHWRRLAELAVGDYPGGVSLRHAGLAIQIKRTR